MEESVRTTVPLAGTASVQHNGPPANLAAINGAVVWPAELLAVAEQQHLRELLDPMLKATREIFPTARWIKVYAEVDYQYPDQKNIIFDVKVANLAYAQSRDARKVWHAEMLRLLPPVFIHHFILLLHLVSE